MYIKFLNTKKPIECTVVPSGNIVTLKFKDEVVVNTKGFHCYLDEKCEYDISGTSYEKFNTVYRNNDETAKYNGYQLSNDGSVWVKPYAKVNFNVSGGGYLDGATMQEVYYYEDLNIPTPIANYDNEFVEWTPAIPEKGEVVGNKTYTAVFKSTLPPPEPQPSLEDEVYALKDSVAALEENNIMLTETVDSILTDVIPSLI